MPNPLNRFCEHLFLQKGLNKVTIYGYRNTLKKFLREIGRPTQKRAEQYLRDIRMKNYSFSHTANTIRVISKYMKFIEKPINIELPRRPKRLPAREILTVGEIARILAATKNSREKAMIAILAHTGLRSKEICNLKVKHLDLGGNLVKVIGGKFEKDRIVPMSQECVQIITKYLSDYPRRQDDYLFTTLERGNQYKGCDLRKKIKMIAHRTDIDKRIHPHLFRHSFVTHLIDRGANVVAVQQFAGHERLETTLAYLHLSSKRMQQEYLYFQPNYL